MIYHMDDEDGRVAVLLPHGVLFRGGSEETIRKYIIKDLNCVDAVIGLPANLFHGTGISVCVLVLKSKRNGNSENILEQEHIDKIVDAYAKRADIDKFAHVADMCEIIENGYNLNISRYVDTFEEEKRVDLNAVRTQINIALERDDWMAIPKLRFKADDGSDYPEWEVKKIIHVSDRMNVGLVGSCEYYAAFDFIERVFSA